MGEFKCDDLTGENTATRLESNRLLEIVRLVAPTSSYEEKRKDNTISQNWLS